MWWNKKQADDPGTTIDVLDDIVVAPPRSVSAMVLYQWDPLGSARILSRPPCDEHDTVEITEHGDHFRRWRCTNCDQTFTTNERNPAYTGATQRLETHCRECGESLPNGAAFCIFCSAPQGGA